MHPHILQILQSMRADVVPAGKHGLWEVRKMPTFGSTMSLCGPGIKGAITCLYRQTLSGNPDDGPNALVMIDHVLELQTHLEFVLKACGDVLVTGLGLGCVVRGLLTRSAVHSVTVIERDASVLKLVWPSLLKFVGPSLLASMPRIRIIHSDALEWAASNTETFDFAWHDLWSDPDKEEQSLQVTHAELFWSLHDFVRNQGAWGFPRDQRKMLEQLGYGLG